MGTSKSRITAKAHKHYFCQNQQAMSSTALATTLGTFLLTKHPKAGAYFYLMGFIDGQKIMAFKSPD
jgi:hypothetical protein